MKIGNFTNGFQVNNSKNNSQFNNNVSFPNLAPLKRDTVSFGSLHPITKLLKSKLFPKGIENLTPAEVFKAIGVEVEKDKKGFLTISHYPSVKKICSGLINTDDFDTQLFLSNLSKKELGINETKLLEKVKVIKGDADFKDCRAHVLENLESIDGNATFYGSFIEDLPKLKRIGGNGDFSCPMSGFIKFENLESIEGDASFQVRRIGGKLKRIGGNAKFHHHKADCDLSNLEFIGGDVTFEKGSNVAEQLKNIKIGGKVNITNYRERKIKSMEKEVRRTRGKGSLFELVGRRSGRDDTDFATVMLGVDFR